MTQNATFLHTTAPIFFHARFARRLFVALYLQGRIWGSVSSRTPFSEFLQLMWQFSMHNSSKNFFAGFTCRLFVPPLLNLSHCTYWRSHRRGTGGTCPPGSLLSYYKYAKNAPKHVIFTPKIRTFSGEGTAPSPDPFPMRRGHPSPYPTPQVPPLQLDPGYANDRTCLFKLHALNLVSWFWGK